MEATDIKLLGLRPSPFVHRVQFALKLKSIEYEYIQEDLTQKSELLLKSNPVHKKVPVLIHGDKAVCESLVIVEYIDEIWSHGPSILPSDPCDRAIARFWAAYIDDKWYPSYREFRKAKDEESKAAALEKTLQGLIVLEDVFVKCSRGKGFFGGETINFFDIVLGSFVACVKAGEIVSDAKIFDETKTPALVGWAQRFSSHNAVKGVAPETQEYVNILKKLRPMTDAAASK